MQYQSFCLFATLAISALAHNGSHDDTDMDMDSMDSPIAIVIGDTKSNSDSFSSAANPSRSMANSMSGSKSGSMTATMSGSMSGSAKPSGSAKASASGKSSASVKPIADASDSITFNPTFFVSALGLAAASFY